MAPGRSSTPGPLARATAVRLIVAAALVPVAASLGAGALAVATGAETAVPAYVVRLCRRALCEAASPSLPGLIDRSVVDAALVGSWFVAAACLGIALRTRRSGWITLPLAIVHGALVVVVWNPIAFAIAEGAWWGQLLALAILVIVIAPMRLLGRRTTSAPWRRSEPRGR